MGASREPASLGDYAAGQIDYIRATMERTASFTAVPGRGGVLMGVVALIAAVVASQQPTRDRWLIAWLSALIVAVVIGLIEMTHKARRLSVSLHNAAARRFATSFIPAVFAGALLTFPLHQAGLDATIAAAWLLLYGVAIVSAGTFSIRLVPAMGVAFLAMGAIALAAPAAWRDVMLGAGFGGLHIVFGVSVWRNYGG